MTKKAVTFRKIWDNLKNNNSQLTSLGAVATVVLVLVGIPSYRASIVDKKIDRALNVLTQREKENFSFVRSEIIEQVRLCVNYDDDTYSHQELDCIAVLAKSNGEHRKKLHLLTTYYHRAAVCVLDGICDGPMVCGTLVGDIDGILGAYSKFFQDTRTKSPLMENTYTLSLQEFVDYCKSKIGVRLFSRHDQRSVCQLNLWFERFVGLSLPGLCVLSANDRSMESNDDSFDPTSCGCNAKTWSCVDDAACTP